MLFLSTVLILQPYISFSEDSTFSWHKTEFTEALIDLKNVVSICAKDHIKYIDTPTFKKASLEKYIKRSEPVISLNIDGVAKAYPLRFMVWHEVVNDTIGTTPVAITYSPFSNTSIVFDRRLENKILDFGVTGKLYLSNSLLYDKNTQSWWQQYTGKSVAGKLQGNNLKIITSRVESFAIFKKRFPDGEVLLPYDNTKIYGVTPYVAYDQFFPFLYKGKPYSGHLGKMDYVVVAEGQAWPLNFLIMHGQIKDGDYRIAWTPVQNSVLNAAEIAIGKDIGNIGVQKKTESGEYADIPYKVTFSFIFDAFDNGVVHGE